MWRRRRICFIFWNTEAAVVVHTQTYNRQLISTQTRQDDKTEGGMGWSSLDTWYMNFSSFVTSSSLLTSLLLPALCVCIPYLKPLYLSLIHWVLSSLLPLNSPPRPPPLCTSAFFLPFCLQHHIHSIPSYFHPSLCLFLSLTALTLKTSPCPLQADLPRSMAGYLTGLLWEDSAIECKSPGWEEEGKKG